MARSISANGEVIYGTSWDNSDYGMLYWEKEGAGFGRPQWVGEDVREITPTVMQYQDGTEYDYNLVNGCICQAQLTKIKSFREMDSHYIPDGNPVGQQAVCGIYLCGGFL